MMSNQAVIHDDDTFLSDDHAFLHGEQTLSNDENMFRRAVSPLERGWRCIKYMKSILITALFLLWGCADISLEENPPGVLMPNTLENNPSLSEIQSLLAGAFHVLYHQWKGFDCPYPIIMTAGGEDVDASADLYIGFAQLNVVSSSSLVLTLWRSLYKSITTANDVLKALKNATEIPEASRNEIEGQARFIRAFAYFFLVRWFGEVQVITPENQARYQTVKQSSAKAIYDFIVHDLEQAESKLPDSFQDRGRPNKYAAKALLAKAYLTMAGWPLEDPSNYAKARDKAKEVMDAKVYALEAEFADLWKNSHRLTNKEFIFGFYGSIASQGVSGSHLHRASLPRSRQGWRDFYTERRFYDSFLPTDKRRDASIALEAGIYYIKKYWDAGRTVGNNGEGVTVLLRYADVLLIYAEAANQAEGAPSTQAYAALDSVRRRAGLPRFPAGASQQSFEAEVLKQRNWELAFEGNRWFDLVRKKMVVRVNQDVHRNVTPYDRLLPKPFSQLIPDILLQNEGY